MHRAFPHGNRAFLMVNWDVPALEPTLHRFGPSVCWLPVWGVPWLDWPCLFKDMSYTNKDEFREFLAWRLTRGTGLHVRGETVGGPYLEP